VRCPRESEPEPDELRSRSHRRPERTTLALGPGRLVRLNPAHEVGARWTKRPLSTNANAIDNAAPLKIVSATVTLPTPVFGRARLSNRQQFHPAVKGDAVPPVPKGRGNSWRVGICGGSRNVSVCDECAAVANVRVLLCRARAPAAGSVRARPAAPSCLDRRGENDHVRAHATTCEPPQGSPCLCLFAAVIERWRACRWMSPRRAALLVGR
jgi:hypothetical protein